MKTATRLVHAGRDPAAQQGMVNPPVYHASTVLFESLDALGFVWNKHEAMWQEHVEELRAFYAEHGHFRLSKTGKLGTWVYRQVANAKKGSMAPHRKAMLHEIGFPFDDEYWEQAASQNKKKAGRKRRGAKRKPETGDRIAVALELAGVRRRSTASSYPKTGASSLSAF